MFELDFHFINFFIDNTHDGLSNVKFWFFNPFDNFFATIVFKSV